MATYNRSNVLPYSIGSVLAQTRSDLELLVIGDGCTDDSETIVSALGDERIRWIGLEENSGHQSVPNNRGLAEAQGEYIAFLGHDDIWLPHHLAECVRVLEEGSDLAYGLCLMFGVDSSGNYLAPAEVPYKSGGLIAPSSVVHRKSVTDTVGNWKHYSEVKCVPETELWERIFRAGSRMTFVPRLSVIKVPAAKRKDVYRHRSTQEQVDWQRRMHADPGFEAREIANCYLNLRSLAPGQIGTAPYRLLLTNFLREFLFRVVRQLRKPFWKRLSLIEQFRLYKGLKPKP
mgnify:FL=1